MMISKLLKLSGVVGLLVLAAIWLMPKSPAQQVPEKAARNLQRALSELYSENYAAAAKSAKLAGEQAGESALLQQRAAEVLYRAGYTQDSLPFFEQSNKLAPEGAPHNWQRGIALASAGKWKEGAEQFKTHHDVNPDDVENSAWYFLCVAKSKDLKAAEATVIPSRGDGRQPMMSILQMLKKEITPEAVVEAAKSNTPEGRSRQTALFYADLYLGLYYDSLNDDENAIKYLKRSCGYGIDGYMADTARVYLADRFPEADKKELSN